jgi:hypothetical protein
MRGKGHAPVGAGKASHGQEPASRAGALCTAAYGSDGLRLVRRAGRTCLAVPQPASPRFEVASAACSRRSQSRRSQSGCRYEAVSTGGSLRQFHRVDEHLVARVTFEILEAAHRRSPLSKLRQGAGRIHRSADVRPPHGLQVFLGLQRLMTLHCAWPKVAGLASRKLKIPGVTYGR